MYWELGQRTLIVSPVVIYLLWRTLCQPKWPFPIVYIGQHSPQSGKEAICVYMCVRFKPIDEFDLRLLRWIYVVHIAICHINAYSCLYVSSLVWTWPSLLSTFSENSSSNSWWSSRCSTKLSDDIRANSAHCNSLCRMIICSISLSSNARNLFLVCVFRLELDNGTFGQSRLSSILEQRKYTCTHADKTEHIRT